MGFQLEANLYSVDSLVSPYFKGCVKTWHFWNQKPEVYSAQVSNIVFYRIPKKQEQ